MKKGTIQQRGIRKVVKALSDEYRDARQGSRHVAGRLLCACRFVTCSLSLIFADAVHAFGETASANQVNIDVVNERLRISYYDLCSMLICILFINFVIAALVWLVRPRTTKRQRLVVLVLGVLFCLAEVLFNPLRVRSGSAGELFLAPVFLFLILFLPFSAWLACIFELFRSRSARSGVYFAVSGLLFVALFGGRTVSANLFYDVNLPEYSDGQPGVEAQSSARPVVTPQ
jgi:hypothetical protein